MLGIHDFPMFLAAAVMLAVLPGPDTLYVLGRTVAQGKRAGLWSLAGIGTGCLGHVLASTLGLSALLAASPLAFVALKWLGALYLAWLGAQLLLEAWRGGQGAAAVAAARAAGRVDFGRLYRQGIVTNLLNPKVGLFFVSFLPQFVDPATKSAWTFAILGVTFVVIGLVWILVLMVALDFSTRQWHGRQTFNRVMKGGTGTLFVGLATKLALER